MVFVNVMDLCGAIRSLGPKFDAFHLLPCGGCRAPMWQQPCNFCGYYPMGYSAEYQSSFKPLKKDSFVETVKRSGGILEFYLKGFMSCVDPQVHLLNQARVRALELDLRFPSAEEIWDYYTSPEFLAAYRRMTTAYRRIQQS